MKTTSYNPSPLEVELANGLCQPRSELEQYLGGNQIEHRIEPDSPRVVLKLQDAGGDRHEIVIKHYSETRPNPR